MSATAIACRTHCRNSSSYPPWCSNNANRTASGIVISQFPQGQQSHPGISGKNLDAKRCSGGDTPSDRIWKTFYQLKQWDHRGYELL
jgi:hypothetical protein